MADTLPTAANLIKLNDKNVVDLGVTDILKSTPAIAAITAIPASAGEQHKYLKRTTAPSAGARATNAGLDRTFAADTIVTVDLDYFDSDHIVDIKQAKGFSKGDPDAYIEKQIPGHVEAALYKAEEKMFADLRASLGFTVNAMTINATASDVGATTSVYAVRVDGDKEFAGVFGNDGSISVDPTSTSLTRDGDGKTFTAYVTPIGLHFGVQVGSVYAVARICNLSETTGKKLTDVLLSKLSLKAPSGRPFTHLFMNRQSYGQLQQSRTATNPTGSEAAFPEVVLGMKVVVVDSIGITEAVVTAS